MTSNEQEAIYSRIERMEDKLDKLVSAVTELVHVEKRLNYLSDQIKLHDTRIDTLEQRAPIWDLAVKVVWGEVGLVLTAFIVGVLGLIFIGN